MTPIWTPVESSIVIPVAEASQAAAVRRQAMHAAERLGFSETLAAKVGLAATEMATNLVKYATGGRMVLQVLHHEDVAGLDLLALDEGPGMANVAQCLRDGYSTTGTLGTGLGAVRRQAEEFDIHSLLGSGTAMVACFRSRPDPSPPALPPLEVGVVSVPLAGEQVCGDSWYVQQGPSRALLAMADGLGHGPDAAEAARGAARVAWQNAALAPARVLELAHGALRGTRGAAAAVVELSTARQAVRFSGVGNIAGLVWSPEGTRRLPSHNGTLGHQATRFQEFSHPFRAGDLLILHSDGVSSHWSLDSYPGLGARHPALIAGVLWRDFSRGRDDATVLVARQRRQREAV
ncbi:MAG: SpoIIE family protein phosphatase [Acidobacteria bacterium]|nr:SpoIIE family protein phosphatase [Acidobacteriota bacterium]